MGFIESLLGSGLANAIALHSVAGDLKDQPVSSSEINDYQRTGIQKELFKRAEKAIKREQYEMALPFLIRALRLDPSYLYYYSSIGVCFQNLGKFDCALECYDKALDLAAKSWACDYALVSNKLFDTPQFNARIRDHNKYLKSLRKMSKVCEEQIERPNKSIKALKKGTSDKNNESKSKKVRINPKKNATKCNNRGG